ADNPGTGRIAPHGGASDVPGDPRGTTRLADRLAGQPARGSPVRMGQVAGVEAALLLGGVLPPPAALALRLAGRDRAGAGGAADRDEAALVERADRRRALAQVGPQLLVAPAGQRVELDQRAGDPEEDRILLDHRHRRA